MLKDDLSNDIMQFQNFKALCCFPHHPRLALSLRVGCFSDYSTITMSRTWPQNSHSVYSSDKLVWQLGSDFLNNSDFLLTLKHYLYFNTISYVNCFLLVYWYTLKGTKHFTVVTLQFTLFSNRQLALLYCTAGPLHTVNPIPTNPGTTGTWINMHTYSFLVIIPQAITVCTGFDYVKSYN